MLQNASYCREMLSTSPLKSNTDQPGRDTHLLMLLSEAHLTNKSLTFNYSTGLESLAAC